MNSPGIKICGITSARDALACAEAGADYLGFIFVRSSPRYIPPAAAARIVRMLPPGVAPVGVFVDEPVESLRAIVGESGVRMAQLSGDESPEDCRLIPCPVIKAFRHLPGTGGLPAASAYPVAARLADGLSPGRHGGTGKAADPGLVRALAAAGPMVLAGGLDYSNVAGRIAEFRPFAVDVSSGVESRPGVKDHALVRLFCSTVKSSTY